MTSERIDRFEAEVAEFRLKTGGGAAEKAMSRLGAILMGLAVVVGIGSYVQSTKLDDVRDQNELIVLALLCVALAVVGGALFLWTRMANFWRFWMLRQMYEHQAHLDQILEHRP